jgi:hypothetical protein
MLLTVPTCRQGRAGDMGTDSWGEDPGAIGYAPTGSPAWRDGEEAPGRPGMHFRAVELPAGSARGPVRIAGPAVPTTGRRKHARRSIFRACNGRLSVSHDE